MPESKALPTRIAERLTDFLGEFAPKVAALQRPVLGNVPVNKQERQRRWWQQDPDWTPERERLLLTGMNPDGTPAINPKTGRPVTPMSREDVGLLRFPHREIDARAFGMGDPQKEAEYARDMSALGPPPPEPLEAAAMAVQDGAGPQAQGTSQPRVQPLQVPPSVPEMVPPQLPGSLPGLTPGLPGSLPGSLPGLPKEAS